MTKRTDIQTRTCLVTRSKADIIIIRFADDQVLDSADMYEINAACAELCNGDQLPHLIITGLRLSTTKDSRTADIMEQRVRNTLCEVIVINNLATRLAAKLYYRINKVPFDVRHCRTENEALQWLRINYIDKNEGTELHTGKMV